jgi:hypothetical protein
VYVVYNFGTAVLIKLAVSFLFLAQYVLVTKMEMEFMAHPVLVT